MNLVRCLIWALAPALVIAGCSVERSGLGSPEDARADVIGMTDGSADGAPDAPMDGGPGDAAADAPPDAPADAPMDAPPDAPVDACPGVAETCNGADDDCDGMVDETFDLETDVSHCGECGMACPADPTNATAVCTAGECGIACDDGFADCDGMASTGCEADLGSASTCGDCSTSCSSPTPACEGNPTDGWSCTDTCPSDTVLCTDTCVDTDTSVSHCGSCDSPCPSRDNASRTCTSGTCGFECTTGFGDCDGDASNGCEQSLVVPDHCGTCDTVCPSRDNATRTCDGASCGYACMSGFEDCDGDASNGCETDLSDPATCGSCTNSCPDQPHSSPTCSSTGMCGISCDSGWANCDGDSSDGCEADLSSDATCGDCSTTCTGSESCMDGTCVASITVSGVDYTVIAHGGSLTVTGSGFTSATSVDIGGTAQTFTPVDDGTITIETVDDATPTGSQTLTVSNDGGSSGTITLTVIHLVVNEVDVETESGTDDDQFVEVSTGGVPGVSLAGYTLVLFDGFDDQSYLSEELSVSADSNGYVVVGNANVSPAITIADEVMEDGPAAAAIYQGPGGDYPDGTAATSTALIDAVVYSRYMATDDTGLLDPLLFGGGARVQIEGDTRDGSFSRCGAARRDGRAWETDRSPSAWNANDCP